VRTVLTLTRVPLLPCPFLEAAAANVCLSLGRLSTRKTTRADLQSWCVTFTLTPGSF